jgi:hypothetical protein
MGHLQAVVAAGGGQPRRGAADLAIAATARVHAAILLTANRRDFAAVADLIDVRAPNGSARTVPGNAQFSAVAAGLPQGLGSAVGTAAEDEQQV